jgi:hypothetical protein
VDVPAHENFCHRMAHEFAGAQLALRGTVTGLAMMPARHELPALIAYLA